MTDKNTNNILDDEKLSNVTGGNGDGDNIGLEGYCANCGKIVPVQISTGGRYRCTICNSKIEDEATIHYRNI